MVSKKKIEKAEKEAGFLLGSVEKYSRQIWLAGLGAFSKISSDGTKLFDTLVKDGEEAEQQAKEEVDKGVDTVKSSARSAKSRVGGVKERALGKWGELEEAFDKRLNSAISRLGVPSRSEVETLHDKVDTLTRQIERLTGHSMKEVTPKPTVSRTAALKPPPAKPASRAAASKAKPASKAAAKPVAAAKPAVKKAASTAKTAAKPAAKPATARKPAARKATPKAADAPSATGANSASSPAPSPASTPAPSTAAS